MLSTPQQEDRELVLENRISTFYNPQIMGLFSVPALYSLMSDLVTTNHFKSKLKEDCLTD